MIADVAELQREPGRGISPALEIRFHFVDSSKAIFVQRSSERVDYLERHIYGSNLFGRSRIVVADDYSKSVFVCSEINRVDLIFFDSPKFGSIPADYSDLVELTESEFGRHVPVDEPGRLELRDQQRNVGDLLVSFLHLRMRGGAHVYLMNETLVKLPAENQLLMQRMLSKRTYPIRLAEGGQGFLNLQNLIGYTVYPGVREIPSDSWIAEPKTAATSHVIYETS
jgi:hypothetical protein